MRRVLAGFLALALLAAGCAHSLSKAPSVALAGVGIDSIGLFEQRYVLTLRVQNPNDVAIPLEGLDFDVELNGRHFAHGVSNVAVTIPRLGEALLDVKASSDLAAFLRQWKDLEKSGATGLEYRVKGRLRVGGYGIIPFDRRGETLLPRLLEPEERPAQRPGGV